MSRTKSLTTIFLVILLATSMALTIVPQADVSGEVINGYDYNAATAAAIHEGMNWDLP